MKSLSSLLPALTLAALLALTACTSSPEAEPDASSQYEGPVSVVDMTASEEGEGWYSRSRDGHLTVFGRHDDNWSNHTLWWSELKEEWTEPAVMPFSGTFNDRGGRFYPGLDALIFSSDRPLPGESEADDFNLWIVIHDGIQWLEPEPMSTLNSDADDFHASVAEDGSVFFSSTREGGQGRSDVYRAELGIDGYEVSSVGAPINSERSEADAWVDVSMRYVIFSRTDDPQGQGGDDLFISFAGEEGWGEPTPLSTIVNSPEYEYGAWVSHDGNTLFYTTHRNGDADIVSIPMSELDIAWPETE